MAKLKTDSFRDALNDLTYTCTCGHKFGEHEAEQPNSCTKCMCKKYERAH